MLRLKEKGPWSAGLAAFASGVKYVVMYFTPGLGADPLVLAAFASGVKYAVVYFTPGLGADPLVLAIPTNGARSKAFANCKNNYLISHANCEGGSELIN